MDAEQVFKTKFISRIVKQYLYKNPDYKEPIDVCEALNLIERIGAVKKALLVLRNAGKIIKDDNGFHYIGEAEVPGTVADQVWDLMRYSRVFTANSLILGTSAKKHYVLELLCQYQKAGYIKVIGKQKIPGHRRSYNQYQMLTDRRIRPCPQTMKERERN